jgi:hypothetical protein
LSIHFQILFDGGFRKAIQNVSTWASKIYALPEFKARLGNLKFAERAIKPTFAVAAVHEEKKVAAAKPAKEQAHGHEDDGEVHEKKKEDPLDVLPPSPFDLYAFKTYFVNLK